MKLRIDLTHCTKEEMDRIASALQTAGFGDPHEVNDATPVFADVYGPAGDSSVINNLMGTLGANGARVVRKTDEDAPPKDEPKPQQDQAESSSQQ